MPRFVHECHLRWSDMDAYGHVNNVQFLRYLEDARVHMIFTLSPELGFKGADGAMIVVRHEIEYLRVLDYHPEPVRVEVWTSSVGAARFELGYEVCDDAGVYARASSVLATFDLDTGRPRRMTANERALLERYRP